jgi:hypothetical protein
MDGSVVQLPLLVLHHALPESIVLGEVQGFIVFTVMLEPVSWVTAEGLEEIAGRQLI